MICSPVDFCAGSAAPPKELLWGRLHLGNVGSSLEEGREAPGAAVPRGRTWGEAHGTSLRCSLHVPKPGELMSPKLPMPHGEKKPLSAIWPQKSEFAPARAITHGPRAAEITELGTKTVIKPGPSNLIPKQRARGDPAETCSRSLHGL